MAGGKEFELLFKLSASLGSNFKNSFSAAKNATKDLQENLKKSNETARNISGYQKLQAGLENSNLKLSDQKKRLEELKAKQEEAGGSSGKLAAEIRKQESAIEQTKNKIKQQEQGLGELKEKLDQAGVSTNNLSKANENLSQHIEKVKAAQDKMAAIGALQEENRKKIASTKKELLGTVGAITAVGTGTIVAMNKAAAATDRVDKLSQKIGISRKGFQEWDFILSQSGTTIEKMQVGMKTLVQRMNESRRGAGVGASAMATLGVSVQDASGKMKNQEQVFEEVVSKMQKIPEGAEKSRLAFELFGKAGLELMPLLNSTGGTVEDLKKKAEELGIVLSDEAIDAGVKYTDTMDQLKRSLGGVATQVMATLMPAIIKGAETLGTIAGKVQKFAQAHPEAIRLIGKLAVGLAGAKVATLGLKFGFLQAKDAVIGVKGAFEAFKIKKLIGDATGLKGVLGALGGKMLPIVGILTAVAVAIKLVTGNADAVREKIRGIFGEGGVAVFNSFLQIIKQVSDAVKGVFGGDSAGPIGKFFNSFSQGSPILQSVQGLIQNFASILPPLISAIASFVSGIAPTLISIIGTVGSTIAGIITAVLPVVLDLISQLLPVIQQIAEAVLPILATVITGVASAIEPIVSALLPLLSELMQALMPIIGALASTFIGVLQPAIAIIKPIIDGITQTLSGLIQFITGVFTGNWAAAWNGIKNIFGGAFQALIGLAKAPLNAVIGLVNKAIGALNKVKIPSWVPLVGGKGINIPQIPMLAKGTTFAPDTYIAGEKGPELITGAKGSNVFTTASTKNIFGRLKEAILTGKENLQNFGPKPQLAYAGVDANYRPSGAKSIVIESKPTFIMQNGNPEEIEAALKRNNEELKREIKDELANEEEDKRRRGY